MTAHTRISIDTLDNANAIHQISSISFSITSSSTFLQSSCDHVRSCYLYQLAYSSIINAGYQLVYMYVSLSPFLVELGARNITGLWRVSIAKAITNVMLTSSQIHWVMLDF